MPEDPEKDGLPPVTDPLLKGTPHHLESRLSSLDPELKELVEKAMADKYNSESKFRQADERARKTEIKLNELVTEKQVAETKRLEEEGKYKELATQARAEVDTLKAQFAHQTLQSNLDRELNAAGAVDSDLMATALQSKYADELRSDPSKAGELVARLKQDKPLLFKAIDPAAPVVVTPKPTGQPGQAPLPGVQPTQFNALDHKKSISEVEAEFRNATKNAAF
jgi:hypothetical protein